MDARQALRPHGWGLQRVLPGARPARGNPGAQRRGRMMGAQRFLVTFCRVWQKVTRRKGEKVSKRRHRKWTMREIKTSTFPLFALRSSLFAFKRGHQQQGQHSFSKVALNHLSALTAGHFLSNATKSNQKTLRSHHPAPPLRYGVPSRRSCSREYALQAPSMGPQRLTGIHARHLPPQALCSAS